MVNEWEVSDLGPVTATRWRLSISFYTCKTPLPCMKRQPRFPSLALQLLLLLLIQRGKVVHTGMVCIL